MIEVTVALSEFEVRALIRSGEFMHTVLSDAGCACSGEGVAPLQSACMKLEWALIVERVEL